MAWQNILASCLLVLLLQIFQISFAYEETSACSKDGISPIPGFRKMTRGVDIAELDLMPLKDNGNNGFKHPVINFSCLKKEKWAHQGTDYYKPDQVWIVTTKPGGWLSNTVKIYKTYNEVKKTMQANVDGTGPIWKFAFSDSPSYKEMQNTITNESQYIADVMAFESATKIGLNPPWVLQMDTFAHMFLTNMIKGNYSEDPYSYHRFIDEFGTHYFSSASFGGYIRVVHKTDGSYYSSHTDKEVETDSRASFLEVISAHGTKVPGTMTVSSAFTEASSKTVLYYGVQTYLLQDGGIHTLKPSVDIDPWLFSGTLKPISDLIRDKTIQASMVMAVEQHLLRSYLGELKRILGSVKGNLTHPVLKGLWERIDAMERQSPLQEVSVKALGEAIEVKQFVPAWFLQETQLCFRWRPEGDSGQCGGGVGRELCADVNNMTPAYKDDTDSRLGGCRMQWGIRTSGIIPNWFKQVKVCYRWYPDVDNQCGGGASQNLCADINSFTHEYLDDTDRRPGGCWMSWRLAVPSDAPDWLQRVQLCYSWYPDGDAGQCGPATSRNLCAVANEWTHYYRDDTDLRDGGCMMSWGIKLA